MKKILIAVVASLFVSVGIAAKVHAHVPQEPLVLAEVESSSSAPYSTFHTHWSGAQHIIARVHKG
jgi:hypothetical protein